MSHRLRTCKKAASCHPGEGLLTTTGPGPSPATRAGEGPSRRDEPTLAPRGRPVRPPGRRSAGRLAGHERPDVRPAGLSATGRALDRSGASHTLSLLHRPAPEPHGRAALLAPPRSRSYPEAPARLLPRVTEPAQ